MTLARVGSEGLTYAIAGAGAGIAWLLQVPLALLVGPVVLVCILSQRLPNLTVSRPIYGFGLALVGLVLGQYFTPDVLAQWAKITGALAVNTAVTLIGICAGYLLLSRVYGHDRRTAALGGLPGGVLAAIEMARTSSADTTAILFFQVFRIVLGASVIPIGYGLAGFQIPPTGVRSVAQTIPANAHDLALLVIGSVVLVLLGRRFRVPSAELLSPLLWSAGLYGSGWVTMTIPVWVAGLGFIVVGGAVGAMLPRLSLTRLLTLIGQSASLFALFMCATIAAAFLFGPVLNVAPGAAILAFSPASLTEMIAIALALDLEPALVAANNLFRMLICALVAPFLPYLVARTQT